MPTRIMNNKIITDYKKLQNGSDIRGISMEGVPGEIPNLTRNEVKFIALAFMKWLCANTGKTPLQLSVAVGQDPRLSGKKLREAFCNSILPYGVNVLDCDLASTPAMFMSTQFKEFDCDGAVMITASHLPFNRNGLKFFTKDGGLNKADISEILSVAENLNSGAEYGFEEIAGIDYVHNYTKCLLMGKYEEHLSSIICDGVGIDEDDDEALPLSGLKVVVDAGNGAGGFFAAKILSPLGADVSGSIFLEPDGNFPNHAPNPENPEAMKALSHAVVKANADIGIIFDTDVDRAAAVDNQGREISRNGIVALAAALIAEDNPGTTVVTDSITGNQLTVFLEEHLGLRHLRYKRGYKNVINKALELNEAGINCALAIETSGHAALKENFFLDDGAYLATKMIVKAALLKKEGKNISSLLYGLSEPAEATEVRIPINGEDFSSYGDKVLENLKAHIESVGISGSKSIGVSLVEPNYEGVRINFDKTCGDGWCLLRKSLHDPIMPVNIESDEHGGVEKIAAFLREILSKYDNLDIKNL